MEGLRAQFAAKLGPLPVWAWALLAVLAVVAWMYITKSGFFSSQTADSTAPGGGGDSTPTGQADPLAGFGPVGLGGLAGNGNPSTGSSPANPLPGYYDPSAGGYVGSGASDANTSSSPSLDLSQNPTSIVGRLGGNAPGFRDLGTYLQGSTVLPSNLSIPSLNQYNPVSSYGRGN